MHLKLAVTAGLALLSVASADCGTSLDYSGFSTTTGLNLVGSAAVVNTADGSVLRITPASGGAAGVVYSSNPVVIGPNGEFSTQFQFRFSEAGGVDPADGLTFVLAADPITLAGFGSGMGYQGTPNSIAIEFDTYSNAGAGIPNDDGGGSSNHVAVDLDGVLSNLGLTNAYGDGSCGFGSGIPPENNYLAPGCMSNGDLWTATITSDGSHLTVVLFDPSIGSSFTALDAYPVDVASYIGANGAYVGFTAATGLGWENHDVVNWHFSSTALPTGGAAGLRFVPITPCRVADTRGPDGPFGGPKIATRTSRGFVVPQSNCGIPITAAAYSLNVTAIPSKTLGFLTIWPTAQPQPYVSTLNSWDGRIKANAAIVDAGIGGAVSVYVSDASHVILDINGYFVPAPDPSALAFYPATPCRIADTRNPSGPFGGPSMMAGETRSFVIPSSTCNIPNTAGAYSLNFTVIPHGKLGYLSTWPTGQPKPFVSTLNAFTGEVTSNAAIVPAGTDGAASVYVTDDADVVIDINGYFGPQTNSGLSLYSLSPCRVSDSRNVGDKQPLIHTHQVNVVGSACRVPAAALAVVTNATVVPEQKLGFLSLWPDGEPQPYVSTLNAFDGSTTSNMAIIPMSNGWVDAYVTDPTHLILDASGYFAP